VTAELESAAVYIFFIGETSAKIPRGCGQGKNEMPRPSGATGMSAQPATTNVAHGLAKALTVPGRS